MTDQHANEEQEMEAEALQAIFDTHFTILEPQKWQVQIYPEMTADEEELQQLNHVAVNLIATLPETYPDQTLPTLDVQIVKGLVDEHQQELLGLANEEAAANEGLPSMYAIAERLREWLAENNQKGLDDLSMHAQMLRKQQAKEKEVSIIFGNGCVFVVLVLENPKRKAQEAIRIPKISKQIFVMARHYYQSGRDELCSGC